MAEAIWGNLQKSLDDPSTIEQAIAAAIVAHEEDPTAHLGEGESLQQHKSDDIIDHPSGSILADKFAFSQTDYNFLFYDFDVWSRVVNKNNFSHDGTLGLVSIELADSDSRAVLFNEVFGWQNFLEQKKNFFISSNFNCEWYPESGDYLYWGLSGTAYNSVPVIGFAWLEGNLNVCFRNISSPSTPVFVNLSISIPVDLTSFTQYINYDKQSDVMNWVHNGVVVYSIPNASTTLSFNGDSILSYMLYTPSTSYFALSIFAPRMLVDFSS